MKIWKRSDGMLTIDAYIKKRKKEDRLNEFSFEQKSQNIQKCVEYIFTYFNEYLNLREDNEKQIQLDGKVKKYKTRLKKSGYSSECVEWAVENYRENRKKIDNYIKKRIKERPDFYFCNEEHELQAFSNECRLLWMNELTFLRETDEMLFRFLKEHYLLESEAGLSYDIIDRAVGPGIIQDWISETWEKYKISIPAFCDSWRDMFFLDHTLWPVSHRIETTAFSEERPYAYNYRQSKNLFNIDEIYRKFSYKLFLKNHKEELEIALMAYWSVCITGDHDYLLEYMPAKFEEIKNRDKEQ